MRHRYGGTCSQSPPIKISSPVLACVGHWLLVSPSVPTSLGVALQGGESSGPSTPHPWCLDLLHAPCLLGGEQLLRSQVICLVTRKVDCPCVCWPFVFCEVAVAASARFLSGFGLLINLWGFFLYPGH